jgi:hypothetical protein
LALLASVFLAACDTADAIGDGSDAGSGGTNAFLGEWQFVSGTVETACERKYDNQDAGTSASSIVGGTETFMAGDGGELVLVEGTFLGFPTVCKTLTVTIDGGTAESSTCGYDADQEGTSTFNNDPLRFEMSGDHSSLTFTGSFRWSSNASFPNCSSSASGILQRP